MGQPGQGTAIVARPFRSINPKSLNASVQTHPQFSRKIIRFASISSSYRMGVNLLPKEYFSVGSTRDDVLAIQGEPTTFSDSYLTYGMSMVMFEGGKVVNWNNVDVNLKARYLTTNNIGRQQHTLDFNGNVVPAQQPTISNQNAFPTEYISSEVIKPGSLTVKEAAQPQSHGIAFMDTFLGETNFSIPSDNVISMKTDALKFQINGTTYDYSGHYGVMLTTPRKHRNPSFGFGTPDKAKLIIIDDFGGETMPLPDATIWEKSDGFIDVEALGKEWIYSGTYTIQK